MLSPLSNTVVLCIIGSNSGLHILFIFSLGINCFISKAIEHNIIGYI